MGKLTRWELDTIRLRAESQPTRARAVCRYLADALDGEAPPGRRQRRAQSRNHRHPARTTSRGRRKHYNNPSAREKAIAEATKWVRKAAELSPDTDARLTLLLEAVTHYAVPVLLRDFSLEDEHTRPLETWITAKLGDVLRQPDIDGYRAWRDSSLAAVADP